jgi:RNA polymerase primary sigma factor
LHISASQSQNVYSQGVEAMKSSKTVPTYDTLGIYLKEIRKISLLTPEEESALARRVKNGDPGALNELVRRNLRFVVSVAKQYSKSGVPFEDLINEGNMGLIRAAERFDVDRGFRFISYAVWWVRQAILQYIAEHSRTVRLPLNKSTRLTKVNKTSQRLSQELGRDPTHAEVAERLDMKPREVEQVLNMPTTQFSIDEPAEGRDHDFHVDTLTDETSAGPEDTTIERTRNEDIATALASLNAREEDIIKRYFGLAGNDPHTLEEIGKVYKLTRERVRQIRDRAILRLRTSPQSTALAEYAQ